MNTARPATKLKSFAFSSRASRLRDESPAQDSPRSREERQDFAKKNPFLPAKDFGLVLQICVHLWFRFVQFTLRHGGKGPSENKVCILARAPGGQMQGAATQAMWWHRRGAATPQMPARRRAPPGCGPQASSKMYTLFPDGP